MGITDKLPLLNSKSKIVKIIGYVVYAFVILMIIGALAPSEEDKGTTGASDASNAEKASDTEKTTAKSNGALTVADVENMLPSSAGDPVDVTVDGGDVDIVLPFEENWNNEYIVKGARMKALDIFEELFKDTRVDSVKVSMQVPLQDKYGNEEIGTGTTYMMTSSTAAKVKWDNIFDENLNDIADSVYVHPALRSEE